MIPPIAAPIVAQPTAPVAPSSTGAASGAKAAANGFASALEGVASALGEADALSKQAATGQLQDLSQLTAATAKAELGLQLTVAFRDRALNSFDTIMRMQI
jgi:flagellar hook-basal body complex protein FliE